MPEHAEHTIEVGGARIHYLKGGQGKPLVMLHGAEGGLGWRQYHEQLAESFTVYAPTCPGFGQSERPPWLESFTDLARFSLWLLDALDLSQVTLAGHFIGGWLAAEMAVMSPRTFDRLILIDAAGIQPQDGEIADVFLHGQEGTRQLAYFDPQQVAEYAELFQGKPSKEERRRTNAQPGNPGPLLLEAVYVQPQPARTVRPGASADSDYLGPGRPDRTAGVRQLVSTRATRRSPGDHSAVRQLSTTGKADRMCPTHTQFSDIMCARMKGKTLCTPSSGRKGARTNGRCRPTLTSSLTPGGTGRHGSRAGGDG